MTIRFSYNVNEPLVQDFLANRPDTPDAGKSTDHLI